MSARLVIAAVAVVTLGGVASLPVSAQSLADRIAHAPSGPVQFSFAARPGVCGDGQTYVHLETESGSSFYGSFGDFGSQPCVHGPARIVLDRAGNEVVSLHMFVGPPANAGATDLGVVGAGEASGYLLQLAANAQGSVARDAIMPAMLADSVDNRSALVALARNQSRSHETRRTAISWLGRSSAADASIPAVLIAIATDDTDHRAVRQQALSTLARLAGGAGIPSLTRLADDSDNGWVARTALSVISQSGDPRARDYLRGVLRNASLPDETLAVAVRSFGQQYATAADIATIRETWPKFTGSRAQDAAISAVAEFGGKANAAWLLSLARDMGTSASVRRRALDASTRAGATTGDLVTLYDRTTDPETKTALIAALSQIGNREAIDKLLVIARQDESLTARRRAISALGRTDDPRVKAALESMVRDGGR
jgi:HEAT repeat protein